MEKSQKRSNFELKQVRKQHKLSEGKYLILAIATTAQ